MLYHASIRSHSASLARAYAYPHAHAASLSMELYGALLSLYSSPPCSALAHAPALYLYYNCEEVVRQQLNFSQSLLKTSLNISVVVQVKAPKWRG